MPYLMFLKPFGVHKSDCIRTNDMPAEVDRFRKQNIGTKRRTGSWREGSLYHQDLTVAVCQQVLWQDRVALSSNSLL